MQVSVEYIDLLNKFIDKTPPKDTHSILVGISCVEIFNGKQIYKQMNEGNGFSNYALYNSDITDKIYCVYTTCINGKNEFFSYTVIDDETIFDKYY